MVERPKFLEGLAVNGFSSVVCCGIGGGTYYWGDDRKIRSFYGRICMACWVGDLYVVGCVVGR